LTTATLDQIHAHSSIRAYRPDPVPKHLVETIVESGQRASTSSNLQMVSVVAVTDAGTRARLHELCARHAHLLQAPVFLAWCADLNRLDRVCRMRGYEQEARYVENFLVAAVDAAIAEQNAALAAESLGLGICYIGAIRNHMQDVIDLLELPRLVFPVAGMTLGWPAVERFIRPRLPLRAILHWERYAARGEEAALLEYDQAMIDTGIYEGRRVPVPGVEGEVEDYGWLEHSARRVSQPVRTDLRDVLRRQVRWPFPVLPRCRCGTRA
jgi:FMN reductase (NADPH)